MGKKKHETILNRARNRTKFLCLFVLFFVFFSVSPSIARAASLYLSPADGSYAVGQSFSVGVYVNSPDQTMNAASGIISFPRDKLEITSLSKTSSIFSFWVQEPLFSNSAGTINFEGIVLNPGFSGSAGKIVTINLKAKTAGSASLIFSSGSMLANDGKGTNILNAMSGGNYVISSGSAASSGEENYATSTSTTPDKPVISSNSHPEPEKWYSNNAPEFSWKLPADVRGVSLLLDKNPISNPGAISDGLMESKKYGKIEDGIWYFHIKFRNQQGWGKITHYKIQIDTKTPQTFEITVKNGKETTNPSPVLLFETKDDLSGIDHYEVRIGGRDAILQKTSASEQNPFQIPPQGSGKYTVIVKAVDGAGNYMLAMADINILSIKAPIISDYPRVVYPGATFLVEGTAGAGLKVKVYIQKNGVDENIKEVKSSEEGNWSYMGTAALEKGFYRIWAYAVDFFGSMSESSETFTIRVAPPVFIKIGKLTIDYLTVVIILLVSNLIMVFGIIWSWREIIKRKKV